MHTSHLPHPQFIELIVFDEATTEDTLTNMHVYHTRNTQNSIAPS